jgi:hypothetical protein
MPTIRYCTRDDTNAGFGFRRPHTNWQDLIKAHSTVDRDLQSRESSYTGSQSSTYTLSCWLCHMRTDSEKGSTMLTCDKMRFWGGDVRYQSRNVVWNPQIPDTRILLRLRRNV